MASNHYPCIDLNVNAVPFYPSFPSSSFLKTTQPLDEALQRMTSWKFPSRTQKKVLEILREWFANNTLNGILCEWEKNSNPSSTQITPLNILSYNVQGWGTRALEVMDLVFKVDSSICVFTEVGELWNSFKIPHFNCFYQKGMNRNGRVVVMIGKHLKATRIEVDIENTVIVDVLGLSEPVRIIGIY
jgi:hypothetical protein